jgi:hypothetical protein
LAGSPMFYVLEVAQPIIDGQYSKQLSKSLFCVT